MHKPANTLIGQLTDETYELIGCLFGLTYLLPVTVNYKKDDCTFYPACSIIPSAGCFTFRVPGY